MNFTPADAPLSRYSFDPHAMRQSRIRSGYTIEKASFLARLNKMTLLRYECGDIRRISENRLLILAGIYRVPAAALLGISADQEFFLWKGQLHFIPDGALRVSRIGRRLLCVRRILNNPPDRDACV